MTICIGVLCKLPKGEPAIVVAADRMITVSFGMYPAQYHIQFEHDAPKLEELKKCLILFAGDAIAQRMFTEKIKEKKIEEKESLREIASSIKELAESERLRLIDENIFAPRNLTREQFYREGRIQQFPPQLVLSIDQIIETSRLGLEMLVAGIDGEGPHLYHVSDKNVFLNFDHIGFHAIGSGGIHAVSNFIAHSYSPNFSVMKAMHCVLNAKKNAEAAPGVGNEITDLRLITKAGIKKIDYQKLNLLYEKETKLISEFTSELESKKYGDYVVDAK